MANEVSEAAYAAGLPHPPSEQSWGGLFYRAANRKNIVLVGRVSPSGPRIWRGFQMAIFDLPVNGAETSAATERPTQDAGLQAGRP